MNVDLVDLNAADFSSVDGVWSSFVAAYFPNFVPVLERWALCVRPGGWLAIVEIDDLFTGHHPLPAETENAFREFMDHACSNDRYDFCMGRRLSEICRAAGLTSFPSMRGKIGNWRLTAPLYRKY